MVCRRQQVSKRTLFDPNFNRSNSADAQPGIFWLGQSNCCASFHTDNVEFFNRLREVGFFLWSLVFALATTLERKEVSLWNSPSPLSAVKMNHQRTNPSRDSSPDPEVELLDSMASQPSPLKTFPLCPDVHTFQTSSSLPASETKMQPYSLQTHNTAQIHRLPIIVVNFTVPGVIFGASCRRYVTPCTEEPNIRFRNVALFLCAWKLMSGRDLARFVDEPKWFEIRVVSECPCSSPKGFGIAHTSPE